jgi:tetraacyldisaccharide 4'-kinase
MLRFKDHHIYNSFDLKKIKDEFSKIASPNKIIITTQKDAARLSAFKDDLKDLPVFALPMSHDFLFNEETKFEKRIFGYVDAANTQTGVEFD